MDEVAVHEGVLEEGRHRVDVVLAHLANVLEHERERLRKGRRVWRQRERKDARESMVNVTPELGGLAERAVPIAPTRSTDLQNTVLHVQLGHLVFVHQGGQHGEGQAGLGDDGCRQGGWQAMGKKKHGG